MKLTNLFNYGPSKIIRTNTYDTQDCDLVIFDYENANDDFNKQFTPRIYD